MSSVAIVQRALLHGNRPAIIEGSRSFSYTELYERSQRIAQFLVAENGGDLAGASIGFLVPPGFAYASVQWGIWGAGGIAVPLPVMYPKAELEYIVKDCGISTVLFHEDLRDVAPATSRIHDISKAEREDVRLPYVDRSRPALILYTSGTTSKPKGVVITHANIEFQVTMLVRAWGWTEHDRALLVLPLHHIHGLVNVLSCALWAGAACKVLPRFDARQAWSAISRGDITVLMAVPTIYSKMIAEWDASPDRETMSAGCRKMRLMVSGSAALPVSTIARWKEISGHVILERYGMTETGMTLSNPLDGVRIPGSVGSPLLGVQVRLTGDDGKSVPDGEPGEIQIKSGGVFKEYWNRPESTRQSFTDDGWFCTGDIAICENGVYRILGRKSIDIIKTGGYKVSALEIEEVLRSHPSVSDCAVVGVDDKVWGQKVCAAIMAKTQIDPASLRSWAKERLAPYKVPVEMQIVQDLPRNALGKPIKPEVAEMFHPNTKV